MTEIHGTCDERFVAVRDAFAANFDAGLEVGASAAIVLDGEPVVDLWGGHCDEARTQPWERDTITNVWSTTKTMTALCALLLADRGELDLNAPVARYWPEFAANGKEGVLVRHLLGHTAGLPGWEQPMTPDEVLDWEISTSRLAAQAPWWEPGTKSGYHAITQGQLVGEVVRRVSGRSLGTFFHEELAVPLGADFWIGLPASEDHRVANVVPPPAMTPPPGMGPDSIAVRAMGNPPVDATRAWTTKWRRAELPAANGHGNARSVARVQSVLSHGGTIDGHRYLSPAGCDVVFQRQAHGVDLVLGVPICLGVGYGINSPELPVGPNPRTCFWGGWGGSIIVNDLDARMTIAYVMNRMGEGTLGDTRGLSIAMAAYGALMA